MNTEFDFPVPTLGFLIDRYTDNLNVALPIILEDLAAAFSFELRPVPAEHLQAVWEEHVDSTDEPASVVPLKSIAEYGSAFISSVLEIVLLIAEGGSDMNHTPRIAAIIQAIDALAYMAGHDGHIETTDLQTFLDNEDPSRELYAAFDGMKAGESWLKLANPISTP